MRFTLLALLAISAFGAYAADTDFIPVVGDQEVYGHRWVNIPVSEEAKTQQANFLRDDVFHVFRMSPDAETFTKPVFVSERFRFLFNANERAKDGDFSADRQKLADAIEFAHVYADKMLRYANEIPSSMAKHDTLMLQAKSAYKVLRIGISAWNRIEEQNIKHQAPNLASFKFENCESNAFFAGWIDNQSHLDRIKHCNEAKSFRELSAQVSLSGAKVCNLEGSLEGTDHCWSYYKGILKQIAAAAASGDAKMMKANLDGAEAGR